MDINAEAAYFSQLVIEKLCDADDHSDHNIKWRSLFTVEEMCIKWEQIAIYG